LEDVFTLPQLLAKYHASLFQNPSDSALLLAPHLHPVDSITLQYLKNLLNDSSFEENSQNEAENRLEGIYNPTFDEISPMWGPIFSVHHSPSKEKFCPNEKNEVSEKIVMEQIFSWLKNTLLNFDDEDEDEFLDLGRKLLSIGSHRVIKASTETEFAAIFWEEVSKMQKKSSAEFSETKSLLLAAPNMNFHANFDEFFSNQMAGPLKVFTSLSEGSNAINAEAWYESYLDFPVVILSPPLPDIKEPEGGYKVYTTKDGEMTVDEYIKAKELEDE